MQLTLCIARAELSALNARRVAIWAHDLREGLGVGPTSHIPLLCDFQATQLETIIIH